MADFFMNNVFDVGSIDSDEAKLDQVVKVQRMNVQDQALEEQIRALIAVGERKSRNPLMKLLHEQRHYLAGASSKSLCFDDSWDAAFDYFFGNLYQATTRKKGKPAFCETDEPIVLVLKAYLERRITDAEMERKGYRRETVKSLGVAKSSKQWVRQSFLDAPVGGNGSKTLGDLTTAPDPKSQDCDRLNELIELDKTGKLRKTKMLTYPHVTCQVVARLCLQYLEQKPKVNVTALARQLGLEEKSIPAFRSFWSRTYWPLMEKLCTELRG
jgi:hypothetical protein